MLNDYALRTAIFPVQPLVGIIDKKNSSNDLTFKNLMGLVFVTHQPTGCNGALFKAVSGHFERSQREIGLDAGHGIIVGQVDLAGQFLKKMRAFQLVHNRVLHLGQVESNPAVLEPVVDRLKAFHRRGIDRIHRRAFEDDVANHRVGRKRMRGAENRIKHQRCHRGIQPDLRRRPGQQRRGQRLRDQHHRDDVRHDQALISLRRGYSAPHVSIGK